MCFCALQSFVFCVLKCVFAFILCLCAEFVFSCFCVVVFAYFTNPIISAEITTTTPPGENKDFLDGIGSAGSSLARGLSDGVSGLIKNPLRGAESGGFAGFAKGVGTGMLGLVVKPVVGVTDAATDVLQGGVTSFFCFCFCFFSVRVGVLLVFVDFRFFF